MKKLQNSFNDFLPLKWQEFRRQSTMITANQAVVAELLRICCEENDVKAIKLAFERILGKPEKVVIIKRTLVKTIFPDAETRALKPIIDDRVQDEVAVKPVTENKVVIDAADAPGILLHEMLDKVGEEGQQYAYDVIDNKERYTVAEIMVSNLYAIAMRGSNLSAIDMLFNYLDGAVADVIRLEGEDTVVLENWADVAPFEAVQGEDGVWYIEHEAVK